MNSFKIQEGSKELLPYCNNLWDLFIQDQIQNSESMSEGISAYIQNQRDGGLLVKTANGKLHVQLVYENNKNNLIGFCITSLSESRIGEIETLFVLDKYQGHKIGTTLIQKSLQWMEWNKATEQKIMVAIGNENVFSFYQNFGFYPGYTTLFKI